MQDLPQHVVVHVVHADAVAEGQGRVESVPLDVWPHADLCGPILAVAEEVTHDAVRLQVEHVKVPSHRRAAECLTRSLAFVLARVVPRAGADGETLRGRNDSVEGVQSRTVDDGRLVPDEHLLRVFERVDHDGPGVSQADLEHRLAVLPPPSFTHCGVVGSELQEMTEHRQRSGDLGNAFDLGDVGQCRPLLVEG